MLRHPSTSLHPAAQEEVSCFLLAAAPANSLAVSVLVWVARRGTVFVRSVVPAATVSTLGSTAAAPSQNAALPQDTVLAVTTSASAWAAG